MKIKQLVLMTWQSLVLRVVWLAWLHHHSSQLLPPAVMIPDVVEVCINGPVLLFDVRQRASNHARRALPPLLPDHKAKPWATKHANGGTTAVTHLRNWGTFSVKFGGSSS